MPRYLLAAIVGCLAVHPLAAQPAVPADKALLIVRVPAADDVVKVNGVALKTGARERKHYTSSLRAGYIYSFKVEAMVQRHGVYQVIYRSVNVEAGKVVTVDFNPEGAGEKKVKERAFIFRYGGVVKSLPPGKQVNVWLPVAVSGPEQEVTLRAINVPLATSSTVGVEKQYGNSMRHFVGKADAKGEIPFEIVYEIRRREVKTDVAANLTLKPTAKDNMTRFLEPDAKVPITGKPLDLLKDKKVPNDQFAAARVFYDVVNTHMKYSKEGKGWGQGDSVWACDSKFGNCSDFHSLFISMARGNKIPAKFEMGFPIPAKRGEGAVGGYHCWAWFHPVNKGWIPVDISEANRNPDLKDYYFGNLTEDRVRFTTGRDINLEPRQKGPPLNFFIYPYAEVDGEPYPPEKIDRRFAYQDVK